MFASVNIEHVNLFLINIKINVHKTNLNLLKISCCLLDNKITLTLQKNVDNKIIRLFL